MKDNYTLLDSGNGKKFERFGAYTLVRPASQAIWEPTLAENEWDKADATFTRENTYRWVRGIKQSWKAQVGGIQFNLSTTDFGHLGVFPEQKNLWQWIQQTIRKAKRPVSVLNLFAYSGGATLAAAQAGAEVCHLDASKGMVDWARENAKLNKLENHPIRWIVDDVRKFLAREERRNRQYDAIILDPPTYGRGSRGEVFKFESDLMPLLKQCKKLLSDTPIFFLLTCHTPNITPIALDNTLRQVLKGQKGSFSHGEMLLEGGPKTFPLPNGVYARWAHE